MEILTAPWSVSAVAELHRLIESGELPTRSLSAERQKGGEAPQKRTEERA